MIVKNTFFIKKIKSNYLFFFVILIFFFGKLLLWNTYFFWDSVASLSKPANFLFENRFSTLVFPPDFVDDNLALSALLAFVWLLFGRSIFTTHIFFIFIGVMLIYQSYKLCKIFVPDNKIFPYIFLLVVSDSALVTQSLLFMTDTVMVFLAIAAIRYMLENKNIAFSLSIIGLSLLRARGFFMGMGIGLSYYIYLLYRNNWKNYFKLLQKSAIPIIPGILFFLLLFAYKSLSSETSFYYFRENSPWAEHYHIVDFKHFIKNIITVGRFFLDYGHFFLWLIFFSMLFKFGTKRFFKDNLLVPNFIFISTLFVMLLVVLPIKNPFGLRYFIIQYMLFALILGLALFRLLKERWAKIICICLIIGLWSGHFWIYPDKISNSWDTILGHLPYYELRKKTLNYLDENNIDFQSVGFFFPAGASGKVTELNDDQRKFAEFDLKENKYLVFSNIANYSDEIINEITDSWILEKNFAKNRIFIRIYKNPVFQK
jgi:hypothetical protein